MTVGSNSLPPGTLVVGNIATVNQAGGSLHNPTTKVLGGRHKHALCSILRRFLAVGHATLPPGTLTPTKKIADAKLAKDFQAVLKEFQKAQRLAVEREAAYAPFITQTGLPQSYNSTETNNGADKLAEQRTQLLESRRQELVFLDNEIVFNEAIIEERDQGIQEIQHQITEVNEIFKDLAVLVHDQGAMIDDIDTHIDNSVAATAQAKGQLSKAAKTQKSNSSLICLLMVIFGVVLLIVIIVLAA
ncbi:Syntaxin-22 [Triticum urartu]|uniref:Syntaxin-22 n=1 Tax=Triticum urartu TaxID=4572 RepID=M8A5X2_TRIUA|nr:Syntaxin-22 [Triticum urartu]